jgi:hypothetical protein
VATGSGTHCSSQTYWAPDSLSTQHLWQRHQQPTHPQTRWTRSYRGYETPDDGVRPVNSCLGFHSLLRRSMHIFRDI